MTRIRTEHIGGACSLARTRLRFNFPDKRENTGKFPAFWQILVRVFENQRVKTVGYTRIP